MKKVAESCKIVPDNDGNIFSWVCRELGISENKTDELCSVGFIFGNRLVGGVVYSGSWDNLWLSIYTTDKRWCNRRVVQTIFGFAFEILGCQRINAFIDADNERSLSLAKRLGFQVEGTLRKYRNQKDVYVLGMLKNECRFLRGVGLDE